MVLQQVWNSLNYIHDVSGMAVLMDLLFTDFIKKIQECLG